jgi:hypothetical protein
MQVRRRGGLQEGQDILGGTTNGGTRGRDYDRAFHENGIVLNGLEYFVFGALGVEAGFFVGGFLCAQEIMGTDSEGLDQGAEGFNVGCIFEVVDDLGFYIVFLE